MKVKNIEKEESKQKARQHLLETLGIKSGDTVYTVLMHTSREGMSRRIKVLYAKSGKIYDISWDASVLTGSRYNRRQGAVVVGGCGMDMGFHLVYTLSYFLFGGGDRAGYAINHQWI